MCLAIHKIPGQLPQTWERSVVFFANLLSLFYGNEKEVDILRQKVGNLESYGSRLVPLINILFKGSSNILVLEKPPYDNLLKYFKEGLNLSLPEIKVLAHKDYLSIKRDRLEYPAKIKNLLDALNMSNAQWVDGYVTDKQLINISEKINKKTISSEPGSHNGNNKVLLYEFLKNNDVPIFDTYVVGHAQEIKDQCRALKGKGYGFAIVKAAVGASGIGMMKFSLDKKLEDIPEYLFFEGPCLLQGWLDNHYNGIQYIGSPSVQFFIDEENLSLHDITEQILSKDSVHEGNIAPPVIFNDFKIEVELLRQAQKVGEWLFNQGYRGTGSVDFHLVKRGNEFEVRVCEVNARVTGATYPSMLARYFLPGSSWLMRNIRFSPAQLGDNVLKELENSGLLFLPGKKEGVLPINLNPDEEGKVVKGQFLFLGKNFEETVKLLTRMSDNKLIQGVFDRD